MKKKRLLSAVVALVMFANTCTPVFAAIPEKTSTDAYSMTEGELVAHAYELSDAEENLLKDKTVTIGKEYTDITRPTASSEELVTIDQESKKITAINYSSGGLVWVPVSALLTEDGGATENITLENGVGSYASTADNFSVSVQYKLSIDVDEALQTSMLKTPEYLKGGVENLAAVYDAYGLIKNVQDNIATIADLVENGIVLEGGTKIYPFASAKDDILSLRDEANDNNGEFKLYSMLNAIGTTTAENLTYLLAGNRIDNETVSLSGQITTITSSIIAQNDMIETFFPDMIEQADKEKLDTAEQVFQALSDKLQPVAEKGEWPIFTQDLALVENVDTSVLADYVDAFGELKGSSVAVSKTIDVETVDVEAAVNLVNVTIKVTGKEADGKAADKQLKDLVGEYTATVKVTKDTSRDEYLATIKAVGVEATAITAWGIDANHFVATATDENTLPEVAAEGQDIVYEVVYTPKMYTVTEDWSGGSTVEGYYGSYYAFPDHENVEKAYIYEIAGTSYEQHQEYKIVGNATITRKEDKAKTGVRWNTIVSDSVSSLSDKEKAILDSEAIDHGSIRVKYPDETVTGLVVANITDKVITAKAYDAGYENRQWIPEKAYVGGNEFDFVYDEENQVYKAVYTGDFDVTNDKVEYILEVENSNGAAIANLPATLVAEAEEQKAALESLYAKKDTIDSLTTYLDVVDTIFDLPYDFTQDVKDSFDVFYGGGNGEGVKAGKVLLSGYLDEYDRQGLKYYYGTGYENIGYQVELLKDFVNKLLDGEGGQNQTVLLQVLDDKKSLVEAAGLSKDEVVGKFDDVKAFINAYDPTKPNAAIDRNHSNIGGLVDALAADGTANGNHTVDKLYISTKLGAEVAGKATVKLVQIYNGTTTDVSYTINDATVPLTQQDYDAAMALWTTLEKDNDTKHFVWDGNEDIKDVPLEIDKIPASAVVYTRTWTPVSYTVQVEGEAEQTFVYNGSSYTIKLPAPATSAEQYIYTAPGKDTVTVVNGADVSVTYTVDEMDNHSGDDRTLVITRTSQDVSVLAFDTLIDTMNSNMAAANGTVTEDSELKYAFMPFAKAGGEKAVVMRVMYTDNKFDVNSMMQNLGMALAGYSEVSLGGYPVWSDLLVSVQGMTNAFIDAGFGMNSIKNIIDDETGKVINLTLDDHTYLLKDVETYGSAKVTKGALGGEVIKTTLTYKDSQYGVTDTVDFYITLSTARNLAKVEKALNKVSNYIDINSVGGNVQIDMNIPEDIYALYMTYMLAEQEITLDTFNDVELETLLTYAKDVAEPLIADLQAGEEKDADRFFTELVLENTIKQYMPGNTTDLAEYGKIMKTAVKYVDMLLTEVKRDDVTYSRNSCTAKIKVEDLKDRAGNIDPLIKDILAEDTLEVKVKLNVENANTNYEAYVVELPENVKNITEADIKGLLKLTTDLESALNAVENDAVVVLLDDAAFENAVEIKGENVVINLNGFTITGNMNATGRVIVVDDTLSTAEAGKVDGTLSGNFKLFAGNYTADVSVMVPAGYVFENGYVENKYYYIESTENEGTLEEVTIVLKDDVLEGAFSELENSVVNAVVNVAANLYGYNTAAVNDTWLYTFGDRNVIDMVNVAKGGKDVVINELLGYVNPTAVEEIANSVLATFVGEGAITAAAGEDKLYSCNLKLSPWNILYSIEGGTSDGAYFNVRYEGDKQNQVTAKLSFAMEYELKEILSAVGEIVTINKATVELGDEIKYNGGRSFGIEHSGEFDVEVDFTQKTDYAIILAAVLANTGDKADYSEAVNALVDNGTITELKQLIDKTTVAGLVDALEKANGKSFASMLGALSINDTAKVEEIKELEAKYDIILKAVYKVAAALDLTGPSTKLGSFETEFGVYSKEASKFNVDAKATVKLFANNAEIVSVIPVIEYVQDTFFGFQFNEDEKLLIVDTVIEGISETDLKALVQYTVNDATTEHSLTVAQDGLNEDGKVKNGAQFTITAKNEISEDTRTYTVIILGDTNSDGTIGVFDAVRIENHRFNKLSAPMTEEQLIAANTNMDDSINIGDPVKITVKWMSATSEEYIAEYPEGYKSKLKNEII